MLASDIIGALSALAAAFPPIKDQILRFQRAAAESKKPGSPVSGFWHIAANAWEYKRNEFDAIDSLLLGVGFIGLFIAFGLKALGT